jgi:hypothetical protein
MRSPISRRQEKLLKTAAKTCFLKQETFDERNAVPAPDDADASLEEGVWFRESDPEDESQQYFTLVRVNGLPEIVLVRKPDELRVHATYDGNTGQIWVVTTKDSSKEWIFQRLYHEMIHYLDDKVYGSRDDKPLPGDSLDADRFPECFKWIFYRLWKKTELRAHAYALAKAIEKDSDPEFFARKDYLKLKDIFLDCLSYDDNDKVWKDLSDHVWGERKNRRNTKHRFEKKTEHLLGIYYFLIINSLKKGKGKTLSDT